MADEVEVAETTAEAVKGLGLKKYLWLYFFVVPLAAVTASSVAIGIAALDGLAAHPSAMKLYAMVVLASAKLVAVLGAGYGIGLVLALVTLFLRNQSERNIKVVEAKISRAQQALDTAREVVASAPSPNLALVFKMLAFANENQTLALSVGYAALIIVGGFSTFVWPDLMAVYQALQTIASEGS
ncbi:MAG: hypothetical protein ABW043_12405 [Devosia sp.]|uniref:hypothetical protein n=1 Tax=Devosia sp. TaxID=1871048 RepID=UPI00339477F0